MPEIPIPDLGFLNWSTTTYMIVGGFTFFAAIALLFGTVQAAVLERRHSRKVLRSVRTIKLSPDDLRRRELAAPVSERVVGPAMKRAAAIARRLSPAGVAERLDQELKHAGSPPNWDAGRVLAFKIIVPTVLVLVAVILGPLAGLDTLQVLILAGVFAFAGWYIPEWILRSKSGERQSSIQKALPDSIDLLSITVQAGLGFDAALSRVANEVKGPLGQELYRVVQEMQLGEERIQALRGLSERNAVPELKSFVIAMIQADILGISVASVLEVQAKEMRLKRRQRAEEQAMKLPVKIVFPLIFCIFPALFVVLLGPAAIQIWETIFQAF